MRDGSQTFAAPDREPNQAAVFSILPFCESGLPCTLPTKISESEGESGPNRRFTTYGCSPSIETDPGYIGTKGSDLAFFGIRIDLPKMSSERHQSLLAKVLDIEIALVNGIGLSRNGTPTEPLIYDLLNDRDRPIPKKDI